MVTGRDQDRVQQQYRGSYDLVIRNADGTGQTQITSSNLDFHPDWQPILSGYARPKGATPLWISLVPAYEPCTAPDRRHGGPLATTPAPRPSRPPTTSRSAPPTPTATPSSPRPGCSRRRASTTPQRPPSTRPTSARGRDLRTCARSPTCSDYAGELRRTLHAHHRPRQQPLPRRRGPGTTVDFDWAYAAPAPTTDTTVGSHCFVPTTANSLVPGAVPEHKKAIWQIGDVEVHDGGSDGLADTLDNTLFEVQGVFVPWRYFAECAPFCRGGGNPLGWSAGYLRIRGLPRPEREDRHDGFGLGCVLTDPQGSGSPQLAQCPTKSHGEHAISPDGQRVVFGETVYYRGRCRRVADL